MLPLTDEMYWVPIVAGEYGTLDGGTEFGSVALNIISGIVG